LRMSATEMVGVELAWVIARYFTGFAWALKAPQD
jgi:hypothetical protein